MASEPEVQTVSADLPAVPLTLEGLSVLHQMFRFRWAQWRKLDPSRQQEIALEFGGAFGGQELAGHTAAYSLLGHKGDLMLVHFRDSFEDLNAAEMELNRTALQEYLEPTHSYLSVIELGLYDSSVKLYRQLAERGLKPLSKGWNEAIEETMERQREAMRPRLYPKIPDSRYLCFYPMDRKRGESLNWYTLPIEERQRQMEEHGMVGRRYAGKVQQIITGSIGFDDWEWGVDLFAPEPLVFKKLIYEMRFDQVSAVYAAFGQFFVGVRLPLAEMGEWLGGGS
jgi:hydrogen peroxide-dependent heme synthase